MYRYVCIVFNDGRLDIKLYVLGFETHRLESYFCGLAEAEPKKNSSVWCPPWTPATIASSTIEIFNNQRIYSVCLRPQKFCSICHSQQHRIRIGLDLQQHARNTSTIFNFFIFDLFFPSNIINYFFILFYFIIILFILFNYSSFSLLLCLYIILLPSIFLVCVLRLCSIYVDMHAFPYRATQ